LTSQQELLSCSARAMRQIYHLSVAERSGQESTTGHTCTCKVDCPVSTFLEKLLPEQFHLFVLAFGKDANPPSFN